MSQKFLSDVVLSTLTAGSMLKLDSNGKIVEAVDGTDYISTSATGYFTASSGSGIYYSGDVRIGTYQTTVAPDARLHIFDYQTTEPKLLIEDGNTGDASMQFKISAQSYTIGIDNSDNDKFVLSAGNVLGTGNLLEITSGGLAAFQNSVLVKGTLYINNQEQIQQGETEKIATFQNLGTERGYFEVTDTGKGYFYADGFKTGATTVGFLKSDGTVDTGDFFSGAYGDLTGTPTLGTMAAANTSDYKTSDEVETYVAGELTYSNISGTPTLGTAAFADTTDFDAAGDAQDVQDNLDSLVGTLGTAAYTASTDYATAAQGALADSALQSLPSHNHDGRYYTKTESDDKYAKSGDNFAPILADGFYQQTTEGVVLATANTYRGLAFPNGGKNFVFEVSIKGNQNANHQGIFWGLNTLESIYNNDETGYKLTHQGEGLLHIRDIAQNGNQLTYQAPFAPNDQQWHRYKLVQYYNDTTGSFVFKVYIDGVEAFNVPQGQFNAPPQEPTYFGFINYTGDVEFANWNVREITGEEDLVQVMGEGIFQPVGNYLTSLPAHHHDARYYTETEMDDFFDGTTAKTGYNKTNWDTAYTTTESLGSAAFTSANDYAAASHTHDDRYYTETESDARFINASSDTMTGILKLNAGVTNHNWSTFTHLEGANNLNNPSGTGGAIRIELPISEYNTNTMMSMTVKVYEYSTGKSFTLYCGGYNYYNGQWYNTFATLLGDNERGDVPVKFGQDGTRNVIWIGNPDWSWSYPNVWVTDFQSGHTQGQDWNDGWRIVFDESEAINVTATRTAHKQINTGNIGGYGYLTSSTAASTYMPLAGGTMTGSLTFNGNANHIIIGHDSNNTGNILFKQDGTTYKDIDFSAYNGEIGFYEAGGGAGWIWRFGTTGANKNKLWHQGFNGTLIDANGDYNGTWQGYSPSSFASASHNHNSQYVAISGGYYDSDFTWDGTHDFQNVIKLSGASATTTNTTALFYGTGGLVEKRALGTAAFSATGDFATAAQGALADSALQSLPSHNHDDRYYTEDEVDEITHQWEWKWQRWNGYLAPSADTSGDWTEYYKTYFTERTEATDTAHILQDEGYINTIDNVGNDGGFGGSTYGNIFGDLASYHALIYTNIYVDTEFTVNVTNFNGDDPHAIFVDGKFVHGRIPCCTDSSYNYTFTKGWHRIDLIYSEGGGGDWIRMGWNPKNYLANISDMTPHRGGENPRYVLDKLVSLGVNATTSVSGFMSSTDKTKLDGIAAGATRVTDNNQLTNGAGYLTSIPANISVTSITVGGTRVDGSTDRPGLLDIERNGSNAYAGIMTKFSGTAEWALMGDETAFGLYDDQNNDWAWRYTENSGLVLYHNGVVKAATNAAGFQIKNTLELGAYADTNGGVILLNGTTANKQAKIHCTNGNLHIDSEEGSSLYLNYYTGTADNIMFGNGNGGNSGAKVTSGGVIYATGGNSGQWNTAYSWGNHASAGYASLSSSNSFSNSYNEFGNGVGSVSNDGSWHARLNVAGSQHARLDVKSVSDGIITTMYAHTGQGVGKLGTISNHPAALMANGTAHVLVGLDGSLSPVNDRTQWLGRDSNRWQIVFCEILDSAGQHEKNLQNPEGEKSVGEYETGTVLVWKGGKNVPCTEAADHMRMGIAVKGIASPLIQGAEPVLVTGSVKEGDYLVTSRKEGHAEAISPQFMRQHGLYDCVLGKALESAEGESHLVKTWINI
jgi:hypothetical protein